MKKELTFSGIFLSMNDARLNIDEYKQCISEEIYSDCSDTRVNMFKFVFEGNYLKISFSDGSAKPRNPIVINTTTQQEEENPRQADQVEPKEYFGLIDFDTCLLWLSNTKKRTLLIDFIKQNFFKKAKFVQKDVYDEQAFIQALKKLDCIKIAAVPNLFSDTQILTQALAAEINGYGATEAELHLKYQNKFVGDDLVTKIKSLISIKQNLKGIVIAGRNDKNLGILFNSENISRKIDIKASVDDNEMFDSNDVFQQLINKINEEKKA